MRAGGGGARGAGPGGGGGAARGAPARRGGCCGGGGARGRTAEVLKEVGVFLVFCFVVVPVVVMVLACFFGGILAAAEGWSFYDGFLYVISNMTQLANPLTEVMPDTVPGQIFDIIVALWSLAVAGTVIGVVASLSVVGSFVAAAEGRKDGDLAEAQVAALARAAEQQSFDPLDREGFRRVLGAKEEDVEAAFGRLDSDGDGRVDQAEIEKELQRRRDAEAIPRRRRGLMGLFGGSAQEGGRGGGGGELHDSEVLRALRDLAEEQRRLSKAVASLERRALDEQARGGGRR